MKAPPCLIKNLFVLLFATTLIASGSASAQCFNVAVTIASGIVGKKKPKTVKAAVGAVVYTLRSGVVSIQQGSTVGFAASKGKNVQIQSSGSASGLTVNGDITVVPQDVVISGLIPYPTADRGSVTALLTVSSTGMKLKDVKRGRGAPVKTLTGKTSVLIVDAANGVILYKQRPMKFSKTRAFRYQWQAVNCFGGNNGVKR